MEILTFSNFPIFLNHLKTIIILVLRCMSVNDVGILLIKKDIY